MPAYNEGKHIGSVLRRMPKIVDNVIVIDDGSKDNTYEEAKKYGAIVIRHKKNKGMGAGYKTGYRKFLQMRGDIAVVVQSDGQHNPNDLPNLIKPLLSKKNIGYVLGSRLKINYDKMPFTRKIGNKTITFFWNLALGTRLTDVITGYHAITREALQKLDFESWSDNFMIETDALGEMTLKGINIEEAGVECIYGDEVSYVNILDGLKYCWDALKFIFQYRIRTLFIGF